MADHLDPQSEIGGLIERITALAQRGAAARAAPLDPLTLDLLVPASVRRAVADLGLQLAADPRRWAAAQARLWRDGLVLWQAVMAAQVSGTFEPPFAPRPGDRRFADRAWREEPVWAYLQQSYLMLAHWLEDLVAEADLAPAAQRRLRFLVRQYVSAMSPANFAITNPAVLRRARETDGASITTGLRQLEADLQRGNGRLTVRTVDEGAFVVGRDLAATPGKVIFRNELIELIQYAPTTDKVHARPLLLVPPWINKYYILDLQPASSLVRYAVAQGFTVFVISWIDPTPSLAATRFADYLQRGPLAALDAIERTLEVREINVLGFCIGGILTATMLAHLAAQGDTRIASATFLATLFDFSEVGEVGVFIDPEQVAALEAHTAATGFLEAHELATTFSMLRENDLIWRFFVDGYLMGKPPRAFDLLFWNNDATRLPAAMLSDYLRGFYLNNAFARPGTLDILNTSIDTRRVTVPTYALATKDDHIAPWQSCLAVTEQFQGPVRFVLGGSGHIAGVINPPEPRKYGYWTRDTPALPDDWLDGAVAHDGSWWPNWIAWLRCHAGPMVAARDPARGRLAPLADAPGTYVMRRADRPDA